MSGKVKERCTVTVQVGSNLFNTHQCWKNSIIKIEGIHYCKVHSPEYIKEKEKKRDEKYKKGMKFNTCNSCNYYNEWFSIFKFCPSCGIKQHE